MAWRYSAGIFMIIAVVFIWVSSAEVTQGVFKEYNQPFAVAYVGTSLLIVYLPIAFTKDWLLRIFKNFSNRRKIAARVSENVSGIPDAMEKIKNSEYSFEIEDRLVSVAIRDIGTEYCTQEVKPLILEWKDEEAKRENTKELTSWGLAMFGFYLAPIWFFSEYFAYAAMARTNVATTTVLFSTTGLFTLFISTYLGQDTINVPKVASVCITMSGVAFTTIGKTWETSESHPIETRNEKHSYIGFAFCLIAAMTNGLFTVLLKKFVDEEGEKIDMQKIFGYIGLSTLLVLWWLAWPLSALGIEPKFTLPHSIEVAEVVVANGILGNVISDYFWALGAIWTTPLVAGIGESLTIPLAMLADMVVHHRHYSLIYIFGSAQVFLGFVVVNLSDWIQQKQILQLWKSLRYMWCSRTEAKLHHHEFPSSG